ncbi:LTA synthase family protein [Paenibacillus sp. CMAA1364]
MERTTGSTCRNKLLGLNDWILPWFVLSLFLKVITYSFSSKMELDVIAIFTSFASVFLLCLLISLIRKRFLRNTILIFVNFLGSIIIWGDLLYFRFFGDVLSLFSMAYADQAVSLIDTILSISKISDAFYFFDLILVLLLLNRVNLRIRFKRNIVIIMIIISILFVSIKIYDILLDKENIYGSSMYKPLIVKKLGILNYHVYDINKYIVKLLDKSELSEEKFNEVKDWYSSNESFDPKGKYFGSAKGKNVIVIQEESLQHFLIGLEIEGEEVTPILNSFLDKSIYFDNIFQQTFNGRTSDAELLALASLYPTSDGAVSSRYANNQFSGLPKLLKEQGYTSFSAHPNDGGYWNRLKMHQNYGFNQSAFIDDFVVDEIVGWGLSDESFFRQVSNKLDNLDGKFFSFLITLSNHTPYNRIPEKYKTLNLGEYENSLLGDYLHSANYADYALGEFIEFLKSRNLYENSLIVIYGDHDSGIPLGEVNQLNLVNENQTFMLNQIPLIFHIPETQISEVVTDFGGEIDIAPTMLHLLGIDPKEAFFMGNNLLSDGNEDNLVVFRNGSFINEDMYFDNTNGTCQSIEDVSKFDITVCDSGKKIANETLRISDITLEYNLTARLSKYIRDFKLEVLEKSKIVDIPVEDKNIEYALDEIVQTRNEFIINGWAINKEESSENQLTYVVLVPENRLQGYKIGTNLVPRPDVTEYYKNIKDYRNSGFNITLQKGEFPKGNYRIGLILKNDGNEYYKLTSKEISI